MEELDLDNITWRKSSYSSSGNCVEAGADSRTAVVHVRDTKSRERGMLTITATTWLAFLADAKGGRLDLSRLTGQRSAPAATDSSRG